MLSAGDPGKGLWRAAMLANGILRNRNVQAVAMEAYEFLPWVRGG